MAGAIFVGGTGSNAGKSWMATALCRLLARQGLRVAPFKAQNMSNNSYPCREGGEIGRSQVAQAEACGVEPTPLMNPVLLKPMADSRSQVILLGKVWRTLDARDYYQHAPFLRQQCLAAYEALAAHFDVIVIEGAGSVAELNLQDRDFTNLSLAHAVQAHCLLVADIERGGVFASILGTLSLVPPEHRALFRAFAVNRFRGDPALFADGVRILEERSRLPCLGVFPYAGEIRLDAEDSLAEMPAARDSHAATIAIIRFPHLSNSTDFQHLSHAHWIDQPVRNTYSHIVLPGTKSTLADLAWLRRTGLADWIASQHRAGASVTGICGGYQMLGRRIDDPDGADGAAASADGLGLLQVATTMEAEKTTVRCRATRGGTDFDAYEIHMGRTVHLRPIQPFAMLDCGTPEGAVEGRVAGTYLHGALESPDVLAQLFGSGPDAAATKNEHYDALADWLEAHASLPAMAALLDQ